jgi:hypothetical protein
MRSGTSAPVVAFALALTACSGRTDPGPIGAPVDLRHFLPESLQVITSPDSTFRRPIRLGPDSAQLEMIWTTFRHDSGHYLNNVSAQLLAPVPYDSIRLGQTSDLRNAGTKFVPAEAAKIRLRWFKTSFLRHMSGEADFGFDAIGRHTVEPLGRSR